MNAHKLYLKYYEVFDKTSFREILIYIKKNSDFNSFGQINLNESELDSFFIILKKFQNHIPLAYILGYKFFYKNEFIVNKNVLIPRFESELLIEETLKYEIKNKKVIDICCGSGCIGISLKLAEPSIKLFLTDISSKALEVTKQNLEKFDIKADVYLGDFLEPIFDKKVVPDFILINPPYIAYDDNNVDIKTLKYEPKKALFTEENGLKFYKLLEQNIVKLYKLNPKIVIICEFGYEQKQAIESIFKHLSVKYNVEFKKDYFNNWRYFVINSKELHEK
ncbi:release factor glutamine methyltransferase [Spiroplasma helicoides]|uniref:peptide chain release factor N(5)-glutamine methyltransferase n=1 Tax=Spiroplasma helicoides TaxID=216938 RepID=A0A1B3SM87_9MOLU|nr:peptide chain release factor N(5)-glutamine methyltransferase [Spiroplasma helicoides]AOG61048.1 release factor glutamine methyltransferase [Spiroplasma helicoides]